MAAGDGLVLHKESVGIGLVLYVFAVSVGLHFELLADLLAVLIVLVYSLVSFLVLGLIGRFSRCCRGLLRLYHTATGSYISDKLAFFIDAGIGRDFCTDLLNSLRWGVSLITKKELV